MTYHPIKDVAGMLLFRATSVIQVGKIIVNFFVLAWAVDKIASFSNAIV